MLTTASLPAEERRRYSELRQALTTFGTLGRPVRVVWAEERSVVAKIIGGRKQSVTVDSTWVWVTDLPEAKVSAQRIQRWGHDRWDIENRFNELVQL